MWTQNCNLDNIKLLPSFSVDSDADRDAMQIAVNLRNSLSYLCLFFRGRKYINTLFACLDADDDDDKNECLCCSL